MSKSIAQTRRVEQFAASIVDGLIKRIGNVNIQKIYIDSVRAAIKLDNALTAAGFPPVESEPSVIVKEVPAKVVELAPVTKTTTPKKPTTKRTTRKATTKKTATTKKAATTTKAEA
ncbi:MAG: hypothetical protein AAF599_01580 [Bacteroidota bacterium]